VAAEVLEIEVTVLQQAWFERRDDVQRLGLLGDRRRQYFPILCL